MSLENLADEFATLVAEKVVALLAKQQGSDWPNVETKGLMLPVDPPIQVTSGNGTWTANVAVVNPVNGEPAEHNVVTEAEEEKVVEEPKEFVRTVDKLQAGTSKNPKQPRVDELLKVNVRTLRNKAAAVGVLNDVHDVGAYAGLGKEELVQHIVDFEVLIGNTIDEIIDSAGRPTKTEPVVSEPEEVPDDTDLAEEEPEDEEAPELTREVALGMELPDLKEIAIDNDVDPAKLVGADIHAVVDLIFGPEDYPAEEVFEGASSVTQGEDESEDEEGDFDRAYFEQMNLGELKEVVAELNSQDAGLEMDRSATEADYVDAICAVMDLS